MCSPDSGSNSSTVPVRTSTYWYDWRDLRAAALIDLDDEDRGVDRLDGSHALDHAGTAHVRLDLDALADHVGQLCVDVLDVIDFQLFHYASYGPRANA